MILQSQVSLHIDSISRNEWDSLIGTFCDSTVFQTWEYGVLTWGEHNLSHAILKLGEQTVAAAQVRIWSRVPGLRYAYIAYGPMWRPTDVRVDCEVLDLILKALVQEYVAKRKCSLRIFPFVHEGDSLAESITATYVNNGFSKTRGTERTLILDISVPEEELERNLRRKWRQCLHYGERAALDVTLSRNRDLFVECLAVHREMHERKRYQENVRMDDFLSLHEMLPEAYKFRISAVGKNGTIQACVICTCIGDTAFPILAATATSGLETKASYVAYWEMLKALHREGIHWFDLRGVDAKTNPGGYTFKTGISGKNGLEVSYLGDFVHYPSGLARMLTATAEKAAYRCHFASSVLKRVLR